MTADHRTSATAVDPATDLRVDAQRNRQRIIDAAREVFAREGLSASMASIAREAGVGKATVSRHFTGPRQLIEQVFADRMQAYVDLTDQALAETDAWAAFTTYVWAVCEMQAADRGFADLLATTLPLSEDLQQKHQRAYEGFQTVIARAQTSGWLRDDFRSADLVVLLMANAGVLAASGSEAPDSWRRLVGQMLRAYARPEAPEVAIPEAPTPGELQRAMARGATATGDGD